MRDEIYIHYAQIPGTVNEAVFPCDGGYNITIDPRQSNEGIRRSFRHAMEHINNEDFEKESVQDIEEMAHRKESCEESGNLYAGVH